MIRAFGAHGQVRTHAPQQNVFVFSGYWTPHRQIAFDIYKELVEINTVTGTRDTERAAEALAARLRAAGCAGSDVQAFSPTPRKGNLVGRLRGTGKRKPILLLAHTGVVDARREDWSFDPFKLTEREMGVVGGAALAANAACAVLLYAYRGGDANMQSVWICSHNDVLGNLAVLLAALGVFGTGTGWPDLIVEVIMAIWRCRAPSW